MLGSEGMDSTLKYVLSGVRGLLWLRPVVLGARPSLPEAPGSAMLIHSWKPQGVFDQRPECCPRSRREAGWLDRW
jgi:hypothetical protein